MGFMIERLKKAKFRLWRILTFRKGIYGKVGKGNKFRKNVLINEGSVIGNYNYFGDNVTITSAHIGNFCSIAPNVKIGPGEHIISNVSTNVGIMEKAGVHIDLEKEPCIIGNDVWIGANVVVLRGVKVGNGSVLAAGAIVNKDVPCYSIVGGVPAKILKYRFDKSQIKRINDSEWYNQDIKKAYRTVQRLQQFLERDSG